jgi:hypothetical protein
MPPDTGAFYFYAEPYLPARVSTTPSPQRASTGPPEPVSVGTSAGAQHYGFYATAIDWVTSIKITSSFCTDGNENAFGLGEFGIAGYNPLSRSPGSLTPGPDRQQADAPSRLQPDASFAADSVGVPEPPAVADVVSGGANDLRPAGPPNHRLLRRIFLTGCVRPGTLPRRCKQAL